MKRAASPPARGRDPWLIPFVVGWLAVAGAALFLLVVVVQAFASDDAEGRVAAVLPGPRQAEVQLLRLAGAIPAALDPAVYEIDEVLPDVVFVAGEGDLVVGYDVLVTAPGTGIDDLTVAQWEALNAGRARDWRELGGLDGAILRAAVGEGVVAGEGLRAFRDYDELRGAMTPGSGLWAVVPLEEARPPLMAVAIDGVDPVRGRGELRGYPLVRRLEVRAMSDRGRAELGAIRAALAAPLPRITTVVATGDILQSRCTLTRIQASGDWGAALRGPMGEYLAAADLTLGSLDGSVQDVGTPYGCVATTNLTSPPQVLEALTLAGFDGLSVATNHVFDCGQTFCGNRAFLRTLELLQQAGIRAVGGGRNLEEALTPAIFAVNGLRIGVLAFDDIAAMDLEATATEPGTAPLDDDYSEERAAGEPAFYRPAAELGLERFTARIRALRSEVDIVIVQVQSGTEDTHTPSPRSIKALRAAADAGADLVVGNQAHWVQAVEVRGDAFIAYALGNFIFDQRHTPMHYQGYVLEATFHDARLAAVRLLPYEIVEQHRPTFVSGALRLEILEDVFTAAEALPRP